MFCQWQRGWVQQHPSREPDAGCVCMWLLPAAACRCLQLSPDIFPSLQQQLLSALNSSSRSSKPNIHGMVAEADVVSLRCVLTAASPALSSTAPPCPPPRGPAPLAPLGAHTVPCGAQQRCQSTVLFAA